VANSASGESMIARFVRVVSAFDDRHQTMTVAELARRTGLPVTTTYRLVNELLHERLLEREPGGAVHIGTKMWELASRGSKMVGLREAALPFMEDVQSVVQHATTLGILDSDEILYIERIGTPRVAAGLTGAWIQHGPVPCIALDSDDHGKLLQDGKMYRQRPPPAAGTPSG